jgi:hypothetical protein
MEQSRGHEDLYMHLRIMSGRSMFRTVEEVLWFGIDTHARLS